MPSISGLATIAALTAVKNKIPDVSNLVKKTDDDNKMHSVFISLFTRVRNLIFSIFYFLFY